MLIYVDANALYNDPLLRSVQTKKVLDLLEEAGARLVLSPVVVGELERNFTSTAAEAAETSQRRLEKLGRWLDYPVTDALNAIDAVAKQAAKTWAARWLELGQHSRVELAGWPETSVQARVERELNRRRPFMDKEPGTIGHRDAVIWEGFLDLAQRSDDHEGLVFVTADKGFLAKAGLHPDLVHDLAEIGMRAGFASSETLGHSFPC